MPVAGNPQLNIRLERELLDKVNQAATEKGMKAQDWVRRLIKETLGEVDTAIVSAVDNTVNRREFDDLVNLVNELKAELDRVKHDA